MGGLLDSFGGWRKVGLSPYAKSVVSMLER